MNVSQRNKQSLNSNAYEAWVNRFGTPAEAAQKLMYDPVKRVGKVIDYMGEISNKKIANLLGSNGNKAVALALLGANVTVVDFSEENEKYAKELAEAAGVPLQYVVSNVLQLPEEMRCGQFDIVYLEHGIVHYFLDLHALFQVAQELLRPGGKLVLQDFHPVTTKLISSRGTTANIRKHKVTGDYFDTTIEEKEIAFTKYLDQGEKRTLTVKLRKWTLGEIVTAIANTGFQIKSLVELPNQSSEDYDRGIPKTFIITAHRLS
ncbi:class I SAM-dependent methyltransferase [Paenibacillus terricola]|uniref:class I SAM-dependent methyltransferase n=1 Tax=Paenibacillus terricola TaxID=2763503 RepID=UPI001CD0BE89|nr:class I SAM-dependent methyltransferase [Paenibacillus terricola]